MGQPSNLGPTHINCGSAQVGLGGPGALWVVGSGQILLPLSIESNSYIHIIYLFASRLLPSKLHGLKTWAKLFCITRGKV